MEKIVANYISVLKKYSVFTGRSGRAEYWYFVLANFTISVGLALLNYIMGNGYNMLGSLYSLIVLLPGIAVSIRRLHDVGKSGWMLLVSLIPFIGFIWLLIIMIGEGTVGKNEYGPEPEKFDPMTTKESNS